MAPVPDYVIPIVFPDYLIAVTRAKSRVDFIPGATWDDFTIPEFKTKLPDLGHAGVLIIKGSTGSSRYYEYGRYDRAELGYARSLSVSDVRLKEREIVWESLKHSLRQIAMGPGHGGRIEAVLIPVEGKFAEMEKYARHRIAENGNAKRAVYNLTANSCVHFAKGVAEAGGVQTPWMLDPRPNSYIGEFQSEFPDLRYDPKNNKLTIEGRGTF